ncbi:MAG: dihydrodipicolinate synthase family protein [Chloroflexi bacterium]|nr:dihydrodipicolinate synthase family protein [Chloroflexota bacterium]
MAQKTARKPLEGVFPLLPFAIKENQEPDLDGLAHNIDFLAKSGVHGFIIFGCMGEFYAPSEAEFNLVVDAAVEAAAGRLAVVVGTTFQNTKECLRRTKYAERAGADGVMIAPPYVINPTEEVVFEHYRTINEAVEEIQIMAYNYPPLPRGFNMTPVFWDRLLTLEHIKAVKESNGDVWHRANVLTKIADKINVFSGGEGWLFSDVLLGGKGIVSLFGIAVPKAVLALYNACMNRDLDKAIPLYRKFTELCGYLTAENEVAYLKATAEIGGQKAGRPRAPYQPLDPAVRQVLEKYLTELAAVE